MKYNFTFMWNITSYSFLTGSLEPINDQFPNNSGFIAQSVSASHWYREVTGSNPIEVLTFSGFYIRNCINCVHNCQDHSLLDRLSNVTWQAVPKSCTTVTKTIFHVVTSQKGNNKFFDQVRQSIIRFKKVY